MHGKNVMTKRTNIVVGFDFSEPGWIGLDRALEEASYRAPASIHVASVLDSRSGLGLRAESYSPMAGSEGSFDESNAILTRLREVVGPRLEEDPNSDTRLYVHARIGKPAQELVSLCYETHASLCVVGTHSRVGVKRWLVGSVAEKVVRHAPCPVLVARADATGDPAEDNDFLPEPPCSACVQTRASTDGATWFCEEHSKVHAAPHVYKIERASASVGSNFKF
jgi:nucleotide-binding universal stress UspA family protein